MPQDLYLIEDEQLSRQTHGLKYFWLFRYYARRLSSGKYMELAREARIMT